jgi:Fe-S cluster assembly iron-binding protein IscA
VDEDLEINEVVKDSMIEEEDVITKINQLDSEEDPEISVENQIEDQIEVGHELTEEIKSKDQVIDPKELQKMAEKESLEMAKEITIVNQVEILMVNL